MGKTLYAAKHPGFYLPDNWNAAWLTAKAAQASVPAQIGIWGDSILNGQFGGTNSDFVLNGVIGRLKAGLVAAGNATWADFWPTFAYATPGAIAATTGSYPWAVNLNGATSMGSAADYGFARQCGLPTVTVPNNNPYATFTSPYACKEMELYTACISGGSISYQYNVDGGSNQTVNDTTTGVYLGKRISGGVLAGLSSAVHTINWGWNSLSQAYVLHGAATYPNGKSGQGGIGYARFASGGEQAQFYFTASTYPTRRPELLSGASPQQDAPTTTTGFGFPSQNHLTICGMGYNDMAFSNADANYANAVRRLVQAARAGVANGSVLIVMPCVGHPFLSDSGVTAGATAAQMQTWQNFKRQAFDIAASYGCAYLDLEQRWGITPVASGYMAANDIHPTIAGHQDLANAILSVI